MVKVSLPNLSDFIFSYDFGLQEKKNSFRLHSHMLLALLKVQTYLLFSSPYAVMKWDLSRESQQV